MAAWAVDALIVLGATLVLLLLTMWLVILAADLALAAFLFSQFLLSVGYRIWLEWHWRGQTVGKRLLGLRVVDGQGLRLRFSQVVIRNVLRFVDMLPAAYAVGGVVCILSPRCQRLGDLVADTLVIRTNPSALPPLDYLDSNKYNSLRDYPHLVARLRQATSPEETVMLARALARREHLESSARVALYAELAAHFQNKVRFPTEAIEGLSDEQYLRDVADVLLRTRADRQTALSHASPFSSQPSAP